MVALHSPQSTPEATVFYQQAICALNESGIPFLVGGGYGILAHTQISRMTKDFDVFVLPESVDAVLCALENAGFQTEIAYTHWLAKAYSGDDFVDIIFNSGNGCCPVDQRWFDHAIEADLMGHRLKVCPVEETIWQKAFIMERERFDGADVAHLLKAKGATLDWERLLERFGPHWKVLLAHLVLFGFVYPEDRTQISAWVTRELTQRLNGEWAREAGDNHVCQGTLLSREQYLVDINVLGRRDARLEPPVMMSPDEIKKWTPPVDLARVGKDATDEH